MLLLQHFKETTRGGKFRTVLKCATTTLNEVHGTQSSVVNSVPVWVLCCDRSLLRCGVLLAAATRRSTAIATRRSGTRDHWIRDKETEVRLSSTEVIEIIEAKRSVLRVRQESISKQIVGYKSQFVDQTRVHTLESVIKGIDRNRRSDTYKELAVDFEGVQAYIASAESTEERLQEIQTTTRTPRWVRQMLLLVRLLGRAVQQVEPLV